jgi:hypothetical protein
MNKQLLHMLNLMVSIQRDMIYFASWTTTQRHVSKV